MSTVAWFLDFSIPDSIFDFFAWILYLRMMSESLVPIRNRDGVQLHNAEGEPHPSMCVEVDVVYSVTQEYFTCSSAAQKSQEISLITLILQIQSKWSACQDKRCY